MDTLAGTEQMAKTKVEDGRFTFAVNCPDAAEGQELLKTIKLLAVQNDNTIYQVVKEAINLYKKELKKQ